MLGQEPLSMLSLRAPKCSGTAPSNVICSICHVTSCFKLDDGKEKCCYGQQRRQKALLVYKTRLEYLGQV